MMTQDRATGQPMATPASPRLLNLNPSAQPFRQAPSGSTPPKNLNPSAPAFQQSGERSPSEGSYLGQEAGSPGLLTNGDIHQNNTTYSLVSLGGSGASFHRGAALSQLQASHQIPALGAQGAPLVGPNQAAHQMPPQSNQKNQTKAAVSPQQYSQAPFIVAGPDSTSGKLLRPQLRQNRISPNHFGNGDQGDSQPVQPNGALVGGVLSGQSVGGGGEEEAEESGGADAASGEGVRYPDSVLEPIKKQMQFYFSAENLPNDKFLNSKMDNDKYIPLDIFLDFGRIKPICSNYEQLAQAVESSSILELNDTRTKVRVSQCRKTLTLRGFPANATDDDIRQFILDMGASPPTHIEFVMVKDKCSTWYVSFKDESIALNCFFSLHNNKAEYRGFPIGCCIKSSGTLAAAGYFPSSEESNQRRMAHQNHVSVSTVNPTATPAVQSTLAQPQQPQTLMQPYSTVPIYNQIMPASTGSYYQLTAAAPYMPYMTSMIAPGWPGPTAMEPGIIMQSNGLQPQHIRTNMARPHIVPQSGGNQHRFNKPQRNRNQALERSASERTGDRGSVVSVSTGGQSRSSPRQVEGSSNASMVQQGGGGYVPRRPRDEVAQVMNQQQMVNTAQHQYVTPMVTQQQQHVVTTATPTAVVNPTAQETSLHYQQAQPQQQPIIVQPAMAVPTTAPPMPTPQTNNPPPLAPQQMHHHHQPPPAVHPPVQMHHHHHQQPPQASHHHQQSAHHATPPHSVGHQTHHQPPLPPQSHHQPHHQQPLQGSSHQPHPHAHSMMPPPHHQMPPPPAGHQQHHQHQQTLQGNRTERRPRRNRREDTVRNQRNQSNRQNLSSQTPTAADNFTMEANSFPPLPGAANSVANSDVSLENRMSDIVRGKPPRTSVSSNSGTQRAPSNTPSPVATPGPATVMPSTPAVHQRMAPAPIAADTPSGADDESIIDDDTSYSPEELDSDETRSIRSETHSVTSSETSAVPNPSRSQKANTPVATPAVVTSHRQSESRQVHSQSSGQKVSQQPAPQPQVPPALAGGTSNVPEAPKPSYAQMVAQKNREAANGVSSSDVTASSSLNSIPISGTVNGPATASQNSNSTATSNAMRSTNQSSNAFREQGNHQAGSQQAGPRAAQRVSSKDNLVRTEGPPPSSRPPSNGSRRNSKENRSSSNKFDRRKPDSRSK